MIWSDDARLIRRPFLTYGELAAEEDERPLRTALGRALLLLLVIGAFVSITSAGRLVAFHVVGTMAFWSFLPLVQGLVFAGTTRLVAPRFDVKAALALHARRLRAVAPLLAGGERRLPLRSRRRRGAAVAPPQRRAPRALALTWATSGLITFACF